MGLSFDRNQGNWNLSRIMPVGAQHTPEFDPLMVAYLDAEEAYAEEAYAEYGRHVGRMPKPFLGDPHSLALQNERNRRLQAVIDYALSHTDILIWGKR